MATCAQDYEFYDAEGAQRFRAVSAEGAVAVFIYSSHVYKNNEIYEYEEGNRGVRCVAIDGVSHVPVCFFERFLGATVSREGDRIALSLGECRVALLPSRAGGGEVLPLIEAALALGFAAGSYYEDRLTVVGSALDISTLEGDEKAQEAGAYLVLGGYDPYSFTSEDYLAARKKWRRRIVGTPELNDMTSATIREKIVNLGSYAEQLWSTMNKSPDRTKLWGEGIPTESDELHKQYSPLATLARAWGTYGSSLYGNDELRRDIIEGVEWMYNHMYGEAEIEGRGWRDAHLFNWYWWYITSAECLTDIFFIMEDDFSLEDKRKYLKCFEWCTTFMRHWFARETALSRICVCTKVGIACEYPNRLYDEFVDFDMLLGLEKRVEGPHVDYSQWTHGMAYNNAYGKLNLDRVLHVASALAGTPLEFRNPKQYNLFALAKYMYEPAMFEGQAMMMFSGRDVHFVEAAQGGAILAEMLKMHGTFGEAEDEYLCRLVRRNAEYPAVRKALLATAPIEICSLVDRIFAEDCEPTEYKYAHSYYTADRAVQHTDGYAFGIALCSKREKAWESINSANKTGWHTGDGATYLYTDADRHQFDKENFILSNTRIAYCFPGTTEDARERTARSITSAREWKSPASFAGSQQIKDRYIVAGMDFVSYSFDGPDDRPDDSDSGGGLPIHKNDLVAKKAYFCLDGKIICLGAGITSTMDSPVRTTLEHRRIPSPDGAGYTVSRGGEVSALPEEPFEFTEDGVDFVNLTGHAGFVNLDGGRMYLSRYVSEEAGGKSFIELRREHGENPDGAGYAYAILPYATDARLAEYKSAPDVRIMSNTPAVQAIESKSLGMRFHVFHEATHCEGVLVDAPCIVTVTADSVTVTDPTHEAEHIKVYLPTQVRIKEMPQCVSVCYSYNNTILEIDTTDLCGAPVEIEYFPTQNTQWYKMDATEEDTAEFMSLSRDGMTSLFLYSSRIMKDGRITTYDPEGRLRAVAEGGTVLVPVSFFRDVMGCSARITDVRLKDGVEYTPVIATARELGYSADAFYEGRLVVIGKEGHIGRMYENESLGEAGAYAIFGRYDASRFTSWDYALAKREWLSRLCGSAELNDMTDPIISGKIKYRDGKCKRSWEALNRDLDRVILWGEVAPTESDDLWQQYINIENMALAYATFGSEYYQNEELLRDVLDCMEWMYLHMYGEAEIAGTGWRDVRTFNWWHWYVGGPDALTNAMLAVEQHLTMEDKQKYLKCYKWLRTIMYTGKYDGASSRLVPGTKCALLLEDAAMLELAQRDCDTTMGLSEYGAAVHKADYVNWTHYCPHNVSYGVLNLDRGLFVRSILSRTPLDFATPKAYNQFNLVRYSFEPSMYRLQGFVMFSGRSTFAEEMNGGAAIAAATVPMIGCFGEDEDRYLKSFIKRHSCSEEAIAKIRARLSIYDCAIYNDILTDNAIPSDNAAYEYSHAWFTGDRAAQHMRDYAIALAFSSEREKAYECINSANKTGWHTGDGATYLYTSYDTHQFDGPNFILNNINVAYRVPGTTEDERERVARSISSRWEWYPKNSFAGGMKVGDKYLVSAMDFISLHNEGPDEHPDDYGYGGSQPIQLNDLRARKAYFCLDGELIFLGAGITSTMDSPVNTTLEHRRIVDAEHDDQYLSGELLPKECFERTCTGLGEVVVDRHAAFVLLEEGDMYVRRYVCEEAKGQSYLEIGIRHGKNPTDASYAYAILPYADREGVRALREAGNIEIISNTKSLQAVADSRTGVMGAAFYEAGECRGVAVSAPCLLSVVTEGGESTLSVSDPTHRLRTLTVTLDGERKITDKSQNILVKVKDGKTVLTVNTFMAHGRKFEVRYK